MSSEVSIFYDQLMSSEVSIYFSLTHLNYLLRLCFGRNGKMSLFFNFPLLSCSWRIVTAFPIPFSINSVCIVTFSKLFFVLQASCV